MQNKKTNVDELINGAIGVMNCKQLIQFCLHIIETSENENLREQIKGQLLKIGEYIDEAIQYNKTIINN